MRLCTSAQDCESNPLDSLERRVFAHDDIDACATREAGDCASLSGKYGAAAMSWRHLSLPDLYVGCTILWSYALGIAALWLAPKDILGLAQYLAAAAGVAALLGGCFAVPVWLAIRYGV